MVFSQRMVGEHPRPASAVPGQALRAQEVAGGGRVARRRCTEMPAASSAAWELVLPRPL